MNKNNSSTIRLETFKPHNFLKDMRPENANAHQENGIVRLDAAHVNLETYNAHKYYYSLHLETLKGHLNE